ncbi:hypothetical protein KKF81_04075 [Candidatus Micrarchaeota archaeon]|nr:hypothetical protein [Candidatus Micrarchaeota archaeon]MBU1166102.1 hypothetical protein [Candidatus Micrarchaeota archaeon]MBU1886099.1 hypothetical protein [Candidatus Micrarchaeota archaeon]
MVEVCRREKLTGDQMRRDIEILVHAKSGLCLATYARKVVPQLDGELSSEARVLALNGVDTYPKDNAALTVRAAIVYARLNQTEMALKILDRLIRAKEYMAATDLIGFTHRDLGCDRICERANGLDSEIKRGRWPIFVGNLRHTIANGAEYLSRWIKSASTIASWMRRDETFERLYAATHSYVYAYKVADVENGQSTTVLGRLNAIESVLKRRRDGQVLWKVIREGIAAASRPKEELPLAGQMALVAIAQKLMPNRTLLEKALITAKEMGKLGLHQGELASYHKVIEQADPKKDADLIRTANAGIVNCLFEMGETHTGLERLRAMETS